MTTAGTRAAVNTGKVDILLKKVGQSRDLVIGSSVWMVVASRHMMATKAYPFRTMRISMEALINQMLTGTGSYIGCSLGKDKGPTQEYILLPLQPHRTRIPIDYMDYMESEDAQDEGRTSYVVLEEKESADKEVSTEALFVCQRMKVRQEKMKGMTSKDEVRQYKKLVTIDKVSQNKLKGKEKGVEIRNVEDTERPRPTSTRSILTLRPLPKIDPKWIKAKKGLKRIKVQEEWEAKRRRKEEEERELYILSRGKPNFFMTPLLPRSLLSQRSEAIRNKLFKKLLGPNDDIFKDVEARALI
ncbi:hypothetical protein Tco_0535906 [Tanacetum coccineum]